MNNELTPQSEFILYRAEDGRISIETRFDGDTVWLTQKQMAELFQKDVRTINEHINNIFKEAELFPESVIRKFRITATDKKTYETWHYNLDVIISVGYRVKSIRGTQFRPFRCMGMVRFPRGRKVSPPGERPEVMAFAGSLFCDSKVRI